MKPKRAPFIEDQQWFAVVLFERAHRRGSGGKPYVAWQSGIGIHPALFISRSEAKEFREALKRPDSRIVQVEIREIAKPRKRKAGRA